MIKVEKNEQFALINPNTNNLTDTVAKEIETKLVTLYREGYGNFIFEFNEILEIAPEGISLIRKVDKLCKNENGILVITTENEDITDLLDSSKIEDIVIMGTKEEAIEAIYLNELENDFREEEDEAADEFGEENASDYE